MLAVLQTGWVQDISLILMFLTCTLLWCLWDTCETVVSRSIPCNLGIKHPPGQTTLPGRPPWQTPPLGRHSTLDRHPPGRHPPRQTPPGQTPLLGRHPQADTPWAETPLGWPSPQDRHPPGRHPHLDRHPLGRHSQADTPPPPPGQTPTSRQTPSWADTLLGRHPSGQTTPSGQTPPWQTLPRQTPHLPSPGWHPLWV